MPRSAATGSIAVLFLCGCATVGTPQWSAATIPVSSALPVTSTMVGRSTSSGGTWAKADPDDTFVCQIERPTGTNIAYRICRSMSRVDRERGHAQDAVRGLIRRSGQARPYQQAGEVDYQ